MSNAHYHIFGLGAGSDDLYYIGWMDKSPDHECREIYSDLADGSQGEISHWVRKAVDAGKIDIFEIETADSPEEARDSAQFWCDYYRSLGLQVVTDLH
jgi:hypothetical protein